ncbi:DoxX family protein [Chitinophaga sp. Cy-1792]|nr:DoxX family protein [Chitinophaga sp. Cy-1792]
MNVALWIIQLMLAAVFLAGGIMKAFNYETARMNISWVKDVPKELVRFIGISEIIGCIGLLLPGITGKLQILTSVAAIGLCVIMILGIGLHIYRGEFSLIVVNVILFSLAAFVAYGRWQACKPAKF